MILNGLEGRPLPIYGDGGNIRDWLQVDDHCAGILLVLAGGRLGEKYNIGGNNERTNLQVVDELCAALEGTCPAANPAAMQGRYQASCASSSRIDLDTIDGTRSTRRRFERNSAGCRGTLLRAGCAATVSWYVSIASGASRCSRAATIASAGAGDRRIGRADQETAITFVAQQPQLFESVRSDRSRESATAGIRLAAWVYGCEGIIGLITAGRRECWGSQADDHRGAPQSRGVLLFCTLDRCPTRDADRSQRRPRRILWNLRHWRR